MSLRQLLALGLSLAIPFSVTAAEVRIGALSLQWADGFTSSGAAEPLVLTNPDGVVAMISAYRLKENAANGGSQSHVEKHVAFAEEQLPRLANKVGAIVLPLTREDMTNGMILFSTATKSNSSHSSGFYLQYLLISPEGRFALFTVEGKGDPVAEHGHYRPFFDSAKWP